MSLFLASLNVARAAPLADFGGIQRWDIGDTSPALTYYIDPSISSIEATVRAAFTAWSSTDIPTTYLTFRQLSSSSGAQIVVSVPESLSISGAGGVAHTTVNGSGNITGCEAHIASDVVSTSRAISVITHEIGHCLGLQHSMVTGAIMSYRSGESLAPTDDDRLAITRIYPAPGVSTAYPMGCATVSTVSGRRPPGPPSGPGLGALAIFAGFIALGFWAIRNVRRQPRARWIAG